MNPHGQTFLQVHGATIIMIRQIIVVTVNYTIGIPLAAAMVYARQDGIFLQTMNLLSWKITLTPSIPQPDIIGFRGTDLGTKLKQGGSSGFEAKLSGRRNISGVFENLNVLADFWTSSQYSSNGYYFRSVTSTSVQSQRSACSPTYGFFCTLCKDQCPRLLQQVLLLTLLLQRQRVEETSAMTRGLQSQQEGYAGAQLQGLP